MRKLAIGIVLLAIVAASAYLGYARGQAGVGSSQPAANSDPRGTSALENNRVVSDARILPVRSVSLSFPTGGIVAEVLVEEGDDVKQGAPLAHLDAPELQLNVEQAEATLAQVKANYDKLLAGASPEEIAIARAQLAQAQAQQRQVGGAVTAPDIAAAQAQLDQARADLAQLEAGPQPADVQAALAALDQAQANLQTQRDRLSAAKTKAQLQMEQASIALQDRQANYSRTHWNNRTVEIDDLPEEAQVIVQPLLDEEAALREVQAAEETQQQALVAYEEARKAEITGIAAAEAQVRAAKANLDKLLAGAEANQIAAARAQIAGAENNQGKLQGEQRAGSLEAASAGVSIARAQLEQLTAPPRPTDLASLQAQMEQAQVALKQAQLTLDRATLRATIDGTVVEVNFNEGEKLNPSGPGILLADLSAWQLETTDLSELDVALISEGNPATITIDALPDLELAGTVSRIKAIGETSQRDIIYTAVITPAQGDKRLRWNMTASVTIATT